MAITCFADEVAEEYEQNCEEVMMLFRDRIRQNHPLTESDYALTSRNVNWDKLKTNLAFRDIRTSMNLLAIAGTPEQQAAKEAEAKAAAEVFAKEGPKLEAKIQEQQAKFNALERDKRLTEKRVEETREALAKLPEVAPAFIQKRVGTAESLLNTQGIGKDLRDTTARLHELKCILNLGNVYESPAQHIDFGLKRLCPAAVVTHTAGRTVEYRYSQEWPSLKAQHERELAELNQRLPELQTAYDVELATVRAPLTAYFFNQEND